MYFVFAAGAMPAAVNFENNRLWQLYEKQG